MKASINNVKKQSAFSAITGIIIVVLIIIILAVPIYFQVESIRNTQKSVNYIEGFVKSIYKDKSIVLNNNTIEIWNITITEKRPLEIDVTYKILFNESSIPLVGDYIKLYYTSYNYNDWNYLVVSSVIYV